MGNEHVTQRCFLTPSLPVCSWLNGLTHHRFHLLDSKWWQEVTGCKKRMSCLMPVGAVLRWIFVETNPTSHSKPTADYSYDSFCSTLCRLSCLARLVHSRHISLSPTSYYFLEGRRLGKWSSFGSQVTKFELELFKKKFMWTFYLDLSFHIDR